MIVLSSAPLATGAIPWNESLYLANGGYWPERVAVEVTNRSVEAAAGQPVALSPSALAGFSVQSLRVCRSDGVELLFDLVDEKGTPKRTGLLNSADKLIVPVECPPHAAIGLFLYAGNTNAWAVPDFLPRKPSDPSTAAGAPDLGIVAGGLEHLQLAPARPVRASAAAGREDWAEVRARCFEDTVTASSLVRVNLRRLAALLPNAPRHSVPWAAAIDGSQLPTCSLGGKADLLFAASLQSKSEELFQVGFHGGARSDASSTRRGYEKLLVGAANLVPNGSFELGKETPDGWLGPDRGSAQNVKGGITSDACFGSRALELTIPDNSRSEWLGWHSREIPVRPGATYLLSGWLKGVALQGSAAIHAHFHDAKGALTTTGAMVSTQPPVSGSSDWVNSKAFFQAPPGAATVQLHLTMNTSGTLRHDGIALCEVVDGEIAKVHPASSPKPNGRFQVWEVNPLVKVFQETPPQSQARTVTVELGRNEYRAFELAARLNSSEKTSLDVAVSAPKGRDGHELPGIKIERVGYVPVDYPSAYYSTEVPDWCRKVPRGSGATDGWSGWWPDPLAPGGRIEMRPGWTQPIWFTVHVPTEAAPGEYRTEISLSSGSERPLKLPLIVKVLPFTLPHQGRLRAIFDLRFGPGGGLGSGIDSKESYRKWLRFIAEHRLGINEIEPPPKFTYRDGKVTMDSSGFDETARYCFNELGMNVAYTPQFFYMFGWAYPPKKLFGLEPFTPEWISAFKQAYTLFTRHIREKGWHDKFVYYVSDEPHFDHEFVVEQMKKLCALVHEVDPAIPIYSSTWRHCAAWDDSLDLWGVGQFGCFPVDEMERLQRAGKRMWFTCDGQMATDTPFLATERLLPYYCYKYGVSGFEFWGLAWWTYSPWEVGWHQFIRQSDEGKKYYWIRYPDGDGFLAYPGKPVGVDAPVSTIRLEQIREGLEDYEALNLLTDLTTKAKQEGRTVANAERAIGMARDLVTIPNAGGLRSTEILPDPGRVLEVRKAVNQALVELATNPPEGPPLRTSRPGN